MCYSCRLQPEASPLPAWKIPKETLMKRRLAWWRCRSEARALAVVAFGVFVVLCVPSRAAEPDWGGVAGPTEAPPRAIGGYALGCLDGGMALALDGPGYQVMRPSRARFFGHPDLIQFVRWLGNTALVQGRFGILVGDVAQPRGGPMRSGHASHQSGLDVDIWFLPAPTRLLSATDRETLSAVTMVAPDGLTVGQEWTDGHLDLLRAAASYPRVDRIFVNAAIKQKLCESAGFNRTWLTKIRPWWGHDHHFHVRLACPESDKNCSPQAPPPPGEGCKGELAWWFSKEARQMLLENKLAPRKAITMADLPVQCEAAYHRSPMRSAAKGGNDTSKNAAVP